MASEEEADWNWAELPLSKLITVPGARLDDEFIPATFPDAVPYLSGAYENWLSSMPNVATGRKIWYFGVPRFNFSTTVSPGIER